MAVSETSSAALRILMRAVVVAAGLIAALIALAIVLRLLGANEANTVVHDVHQAANFFAGSFTTVFKISGARLSLLVNWGIAIGVFLLAGAVAVRLIAWIARVLPFVGSAD